eukprot:UN11991
MMFFFIMISACVPSISYQFHVRCISVDFDVHIIHISYNFV